MKKVLAIVLPILLIIGAIVLLYIFVLTDLLDPPPNKVMQKAIDTAQQFINNHTEGNETKFRDYFSQRTRSGLEREWQALSLDGSRRGSWYEMAMGLMNDDGSRPEVVGIIPPAEGQEVPTDDEGNPLAATVRIRHNRLDEDIHFVRDEGKWRIEIPVHPAPWVTPPAAQGG